MKTNKNAQRKMSPAESTANLLIILSSRNPPLPRALH